MPTDPMEVMKQIEAMKARATGAEGLKGPNEG